MKKTKNRRLVVVEATDKNIYFVLKGYENCHDGDEWIGLYCSLDSAREAYLETVREVENEHNEDIVMMNCHRRVLPHEKVMINIFNELTGEWALDVNPNILW